MLVVNVGAMSASAALLRIERAAKGKVIKHTHALPRICPSSFVLVLMTICRREAPKTLVLNVDAMGASAALLRIKRGRAPFKKMC